MAPENYSTPSSDSCVIHDAGWPSLELNLPDGEGFRSSPPRVSLAELIQRNRQLRQWFPSSLRRPEERWQAKTAAEFHL
ncbi:MAG: hypothetical protein AAB676_15170 [Verrucomicrobiota bacterium]